MNCQWSAWSPWSSCSSSCGSGFKDRIRHVYSHAMYGGRPCFGPSSQRGECHSGYSLCIGLSLRISNTCGYKTILLRFQLTVNGQTGAPGAHAQALAQGPRRATEIILFRQCMEGHHAMDQGLSFKPASPGTRHVEVCLIPPDLYFMWLQNDIFPFLVDCQWGNWGSWQSCTKSCGNGTQRRNRDVDTYQMYGGDACDYGLSSDTRRCFLIEVCRSYA